VGRLVGGGTSAGSLRPGLDVDVSAGVPDVDVVSPGRVVDGGESGDDVVEEGLVLPGDPDGVSTSTFPVWRNPPFLMFFGSSTSSPVALPASFPTTFMIFSKTSTRRFSIGETFLIVFSRSWMIFAIFAAHLEIAVTACATITGVPNPSVNTASSTHAMSLPTRSAIRSRTISRTNATTIPIRPTTVPTVPAADAAPVNASPCIAELVRYASADAPVHPSVPDRTELL
jgi:hypothetical protein